MPEKISFSFSFRGGLSPRGIIERSCPALYGGMRHQLGYNMDEVGLLLRSGRLLRPEVADLIDVFVAIAICDRRASCDSLRRRDCSLEGSGRSLHVTIPVRQPVRWNNPEIHRAVTTLSEMLTGNEWTIVFEQRKQGPRPSEIQLGLDFALAPDDAIVTLHSGGLDSLLGMAKVLAADESAVLVPVSVITNNKTRQVIHEVTKSLRQSFPRALIQGAHLELSHCESEFGIDDRASENRTRILVCLAAGIAVAVEIGSGRLQLTENGPGAINLPTSSEQLDAWTTRATHPKTLAIAAYIATQVLGRNISIYNTGLPKTKGQLAELLHDSRFEKAARFTVSCDRFPYANADSPCGACTSCLYRQVALNRIGMSHIDGERKYGHQEKLTTRQRQRLMIAKSALTMQVGHLRTQLASSDPYGELDAEYLRIDEVLSVGAYLGLTDDEIKTGLVGMYREFVEEVDSFLHASLRSFPQLKEQVAS